MTLTLMEFTAWTFGVVGIVGFIRSKEERWGRRVYAGMAIVALIEALVYGGVLRVGFLQGTLILPSVLAFCTLVCLVAVEEKAIASIACYACLLQFLVLFRVVSRV